MCRAGKPRWRIQRAIVPSETSNAALTSRTVICIDRHLPEPLWSVGRPCTWSRRTRLAAWATRVVSRGSKLSPAAELLQKVVHVRGCSAAAESELRGLVGPKRGDSPQDLVVQFAALQRRDQQEDSIDRA